MPLRSGEITREHILGRSHELASGAKTERLCTQDITMFKGVGLVLEDLKTATPLYPSLLDKTTAES